MKIIKSPNYDQRPVKEIIDTIIIHATHINKQQTIEKFLDPNSKVSSHYLIAKDSEVISFVEDGLRAWHAGVSLWAGKENLNNNSIGIEIENDGKEPFLETQYHLLADLITKLKSRHKNIKDSLILGHNEIAISRKEDPGKEFSWKKLYDLGHGNYVEKKEQKDDKIIFKKGDESEEVFLLKKEFLSLGYKLRVNKLFDQELERVIVVFKDRYVQSNPFPHWFSSDTSILQELLKNKKNNS
jgi:N-acetylmuramoyl-L-alanine amidase